MFFILVLILSLPLCSPMVEFSEADAEVNEVDLNLTTAIERALQNHPQISASEKGLEEAKGLLRQAGLRPDPTIEFSGGTSAILGESGDQEWGVEYIQTLELGNKRKKRLKLAEIGLMIAKQQLQDQKRLLIWEIKKQFAESLSLLIVIVFLALQNPLLAHDLFLRSNPFHVDKPATVSLSMRLAEAFPGKEVTWKADKTVSFLINTPSGLFKLDDKSNKNPDVELREEGTYVSGCYTFVYQIRFFSL
jgi:Outer membrane efflux protein